MKEITAIIRMDKVNKTKEALLKEGFPSITCKKVMGRGKKKVAYELFQGVLNGTEEGLSPVVAEQLSEEHRLLPKRMLMLVVEDDAAPKVVKTMVSVNQNGNPGDGKIFVTSIDDAIRVRTGEVGSAAI